MSAVYQKRSIPVLQKREVEAAKKLICLLMYFKRLSVLGLGVERDVKRNQVMVVNKCKLDGSSDNINPINLLFTMKKMRDAIESGATKC